MLAGVALHMNAAKLSEAALTAFLVNSEDRTTFETGWIDDRAADGTIQRMGATTSLVQSGRPT